MLDSLEDVLLSILDDLLVDPDVTSCSRIENYTNLELFPFYAQISPDTKFGIYTKDSKDSKDSKESKEVGNPNQTKKDKIETYQENRKKQQVLGSLEFQNFTESILEGTLYNLIQEANADEFNITQYPMMFQK